MGFISVSGIDCAARTAASANSRWPVLAALPVLLLTLAATSPTQSAIEIHVQGLRNVRGMVRLCLTRNPAHFPECNGDPVAMKRSVPAAQAGGIRLAGVVPGRYALAVIHDENGNGRLDKFMGVPREGFGFSRNPRIRMGPPRFEEVRFDVGGAGTSQNVQMRYLL